MSIEHTVIKIFDIAIHNLGTCTIETCPSKEKIEFYMFGTVHVYLSPDTL